MQNQTILLDHRWPVPHVTFGPRDLLSHATWPSVYDTSKPECAIPDDKTWPSFLCVGTECHMVMGDWCVLMAVVIRYLHYGFTLALHVFCVQTSHQRWHTLFWSVINKIISLCVQNKPSYYRASTLQLCMLLCMFCVYKVNENLPCMWQRNCPYVQYICFILLYMFCVYKVNEILPCMWQRNCPYVQYICFILE